jgi:hypothetical protein
MRFTLFSFVRRSIDSLCQAVKHLLRRWTKPNNDALVLNTVLYPVVLAEHAHPFEYPPLRMNNPFGLFGLTS